ncbi:hypothetical protein AYI69_g3508 [Smittium culicis]|uniref:Uncharacterized protein n=1 Tax=Smittium culicis TaxID=133412 RepID=A0A1R1YJJ8_9FUNG|nr:hypothetical protein AYI69_g3508 [Smittium culicis]
MPQLCINSAISLSELCLSFDLFCLYLASRQNQTSLNFALNLPQHYHDSSIHPHLCLVFASTQSQLILYISTARPQLNLNSASTIHQLIHDSISTPTQLYFVKQSTIILLDQNSDLKIRLNFLNST